MATRYHPKIFSILLLLICQTTHILGAVYSYYSSNGDVNCTNAGSNDICHLYCNQSMQTNKIFECGNSRQCVFHCVNNNCLQNGTLNAMFTNDLLVDSVTTDCMLGSTINVPNYGNAQFTTSIDGGLHQMTVNSGSNTQSIKINCSVSFANQQCRDITVNAETAQYLEITVGNNSILSGTESITDIRSIIKCPTNSDYIPSSDTPYTAPCIIDMSNGWGTLHRVNIYADYGMPYDIQIIYGDGSILSNVQIFCVNGTSIAESGTFTPTDICWITYNPTTDPTIEPTTNPTINPTQSTISPTKLPTNNPITIKPTTNPTKSPLNTPSLSPTIPPTENTNDPSLHPTIDGPNKSTSSYLSTLSIINTQSIEDDNQNMVSFGLITDIALIVLAIFLIILCGYFALLLRRKNKEKRRDKLKDVIDSQHCQQTDKISDEMRNNEDTQSLETVEINKFPKNKPKLTDHTKIPSKSTFMPSMLSIQPQLMSPTESNISEIGMVGFNGIYYKNSSEISITGIKQNDLSKKISDPDYNNNDEDDKQQELITNINPLSMAGTLEKTLGVLPMTIKEQIFIEISEDEPLNINPLAVDNETKKNSKQSEQTQQKEPEKEPEKAMSTKNTVLTIRRESNAASIISERNFEGTLKLNDDAASIMDDDDTKGNNHDYIDENEEEDDDDDDDDDALSRLLSVNKYNSEGQEKEEVVLNDDACSVYTAVDLKLKQDIKPNDDALPTNNGQSKNPDITPLCDNKLYIDQHTKNRKKNDDAMSENDDVYSDSDNNEDEDEMLRINLAIQSMNDDKYINDSPIVN